MNLKKVVNQVIPTIARIINKSREEKVKESYSPVEAGEFPSNMFSGSRWDWRRISGISDAGEDIGIEGHRAILRRAYSAWCNNPFAGQIVNLTTWFVMGKGIGFQAKDGNVQKILSRFWNDAENDMQVMQHWMSNELQIYGEIFLRFFTNPIDGKVKVAMVDPSEIAEVVTDPENIRKPLAYLREYKKRSLPEDWVGAIRDYDGEIGSVGEETVREVIPADEVMHVKVNNVSNRTRGLSELYRVLPWLDAYSRWLEDRMNINRARGTFAFLRKVPTEPSKASGPFETDNSTGRYRVPRPGSILVVHEGEDWEVLSPKIGADDAKEDGRALKLMISAGSGIFEHYFGDPATGNLATAKSMELPMVKKFEDRQRLFENVFSKIFMRVIDAGIKAGALGRDVDKTVDVNFPPIVAEDMEILTRTLISQVESGILSKDSARRMIPWIADPNREAGVVEKEISSES